MQWRMAKRGKERRKNKALKLRKYSRQDATLLLFMFMFIT